jgi:hypothetical protein
MRGADLKAQKWKTAAIYWPEPRQISRRSTGKMKSGTREMVEVAAGRAVNVKSAVGLRLISRERAEQAPRYPVTLHWWSGGSVARAKVTVSTASIERAQAVAAKVQPRPRDDWFGADHIRVLNLIRKFGRQCGKAPATVEYAAPQYGAGYVENIPQKYGREREAERWRRLYFLRRVYTSQENNVTANIEAALLEEAALRLLRDSFNDVASEAQGTASIWNDAITAYGTDDTPRHRRHAVAPSDAEITTALSVLLNTAKRVTKRQAWPVASESGAVKLVANCPAQSRSAQACAAALVVAICYPLRHGRGRWQCCEVEAAGIIIGLAQSTGIYMLRSGGLNAKRIGELFGYSRDTALRRARADEASLDKLFDRFLPRDPPASTHDSGVYNRGKKKDKPPPEEPRWLIDAGIRARLVAEYRALASVPSLDGSASRCRIDHITSRWLQAWLRNAYEVTADYIDAGGRYLIIPEGYSGLRSLEPWFIDDRSAASVAESFTGSYFRKPGLSPDRTPAKADVAAAMTSRGTNAEGESDRDAEHDTVAYSNIPKAVDLDAADSDDDVADDPFAGLSIVDDDESMS